MSLTLRRTLVVLAGVLVSGAMVVLGLWQMDTFRETGRASAEELAQQPPVALAEHLRETDASQLFGRQVTLTGEFLSKEQFHVGATYPVRVVTAFRLEEGPIVAVVRGLRDRESQTPAPPPGTVTVTGVLLPSENEPDRSSQRDPDLPEDVRARVRLPEVAQEWPTPLVNGYVTLNAADAERQGLRPAEVVLPEFEGRARNSGYALQWWVFAGAALVFSVVVARSLKERPAVVGGGTGGSSSQDPAD